LLTRPFAFFSFYPISLLSVQARLRRPTVYFSRLLSRASAEKSSEKANEKKSKNNKDRKIALLSLFQWGLTEKKLKNSKKTPLSLDK